MNALAGWPDAAQPRADRLLNAFDRAGAFGLPQAVALAFTDGRPCLRLELFRRDEDPSDGDGVLEFDLVLEFGATTPVPWQNGWLLTTVVRVGEPNVVVGGPVHPAGPAGLRAIHHLDLCTALILADAIEGSRSAVVQGRLDIAIPVVAPRLAAVVTFDPAVTIGALAPLADDSGTITRQHLIAALSADLSAFGISLTSGSVEPDGADGIADRLIGRFGQVRWPATLDAPPGFTFAPAPAGSFTWDLAEPAPTTLLVTVPVDPLGVLDGVTDRAALVTRSTIPVLDVGGRNVRVRANLPDRLVGIDQVRARLRLPSLVGVRPQAQVREAVVYPGRDPAGALVGFRNGPGVPFDYERRAAVLVSGVAEVIVAEPVVSNRAVATFTVADLPFTLASVAATSAVLAHGELAATANFVRGGQSHTLTAVLTASEPSATLALPDHDGDATLSLALRQVGGPGIVELGTRPFGPAVVDIDQVPAAGSQTVTIDVDLAGAALAAFEVCAADPSSPTAPETLSFTPEHSSRTWRYVVGDPFRRGVRYRLCPAAGMPSREWSAPDDAARLQLSASEGQ
jgi:hypothetical protein